jgi:N-acetylglutamate synthase-like GNAT family acetyltransferase
MQIHYLADHLHFAPILARWHYEEWRDLLPQWSYEEALADLQSHTGRACIPTTFVALADGQLLGSASLILDDLEAACNLSPWMASVFVRPEQRGKGVGKKLVARVVAEARQLQVPTLYLFTAGQEEYYRKLSWSFYQRADCGGHEVTIMCRQLAHDSESTKAR